MPISHFSSLAGILQFDTSAGGAGNGTPILDFDRNLFCTSSAATGACAVWDLTAVNTPPARLQFHATNAGQFFSVGGFDSLGNWYLGTFNSFGFGVRKLSADLQTTTVTNFASPAVAQPNNWIISPKIGIAQHEYLVSVGAAEVNVIDVTTVPPSYIGRLGIATEVLANSNGRLNDTDQWLIASCSFSGGFTRPAQPFGLHRIHLQPDVGGTPFTVTRTRDIQPSLVGWTNFSSIGEILGDETDGNPIIFSNTQVFAAYNGATSYGQYNCVSFGGHDFESLVNANVGNATTDATKWRDLGPSHAAESAVFKVNAATGALMWKVVMVAGQLNGFREMTRVRYGKLRVIEPSAHASSNFYVHDIDTLTGADNRQDIWNVSPSGANQYYDDKSGRWIGGVGYGFLMGQPGSPTPIGATAGVFNDYGELGPSPWVQPPAGLTNPVRVQSQVFG